MERKRIEIEAKFPLINKEQAFAILNKIGKRTEDNIEQKDIYYTPAHVNFLDQVPIVKWLRIRKTADENTINFKDWSNNKNKNKIKCREIEVGVDDYDGILEIFDALDLKKIIIVDKVRTSYLYKNIIFSIDVVNNLGDFIELEYKDNIYDSEEESLNYIKSVLKELDIKVGDQVFAGYPQLVMQHDKK